MRIQQVLRATASEDEREPVDLGPWQALQDALTEVSRDVTVPYAVELADRIPPVGIRLQRDFPALLTLLRAHALSTCRGDGGPPARLRWSAIALQP
jgi:hypothetical protein